MDVSLVTFVQRLITEYVISYYWLYNTAPSSVRIDQPSHPCAFDPPSTVPVCHWVNRTGSPVWPVGLGLGGMGIRMKYSHVSALCNFYVCTCMDDSPIGLHYITGGSTNSSRGRGFGQEFFEGGGGLRSKSAGIPIYWQAKKLGGIKPPNPRPLGSPTVYMVCSFSFE